MLENQLIWGDCLEVLNDFPEDSFDMILVDLPYRKTNAWWDKPIPLLKFWDRHLAVLKESGVVVLFSIQPFTTDLINSMRGMFKYELIWEKSRPTGHLNAKIRPLRSHENILVFYSRQPTYNPQKSNGHTPVHSYTKRPKRDVIYGEQVNVGYTGGGQTDRYPTSVLRYSSLPNRLGEHSSRKPVPLLEYLIKTYTNEGDTVLDSFMGSGSTCIAAKNTDRRFVGIEIEQSFYQQAKDRLK